VNLYDIARGQVRLTFPQPEAVRAVSFTGDGRLLLTGSDNGLVRAWRLTGPVLPGSDPVTSVAFSPDGRVLATAGGDAVALWDSSDPRSLRPLGPPIVGNAGPVTSVAFSPNGKILATADATIRLWDIGTPGPARPLGDPLPGHRGPVTALTSAPTDTCWPAVPRTRSGCGTCTTRRRQGRPAKCPVPAGQSSSARAGTWWR
jgi:WD40 repeat protein